MTTSSSMRVKPRWRGIGGRAWQAVRRLMKIRWRDIPPFYEPCAADGAGPATCPYFPRAPPCAVNLPVSKAPSPPPSATLSKPPPRPATVLACLIVTIVCGGAIIAARQVGMSRWWVFPIAMIAIVLAAILAARLQKRSWTRWEPRWGHHHAIACMYFTWAVAAITFTTVMTSGSGSVLVRFLTSTPGAAGMLVGGAIGALGVVRLTGGRYCRKCGYEMSEAIASDPDQAQCPECGAFWKRPGGTRDDHLTLRWAWITAGLAVGMTLSFGPLFLSSSVRAYPVRVLPTNSLIEEAATSFSFTSDPAWQELLSRGLTDAQEARLARRLLEARQRQGFLKPIADHWLQQRIKAGALPPDLVSRYVDEHPHPEVLEATNLLDTQKEQGFEADPPPLPPGWQALPPP